MSAKILAMKFALLGVALLSVLVLAHGSTGAGSSDAPATPQSVTATIPAPVLALVAKDGVPPTPTPAPTPEIVVDDGPVVPLGVCSALGRYDWPCLTETQMVDLLEDTGWPSQVIVPALAISKCESGWIPTIVNWGDQRDGLGSTGLFQLWSGWYAAAGYSYDDWADPEVNAATALYVYETSGWAPWGCAR
jgi:hypothetical protein